jgi:hypothetical protein
MTLAVSRLNALQRARWFTAVSVVLLLIASVGSANSQSRDRENPTHLASTEISGVIGDNLGESYYYTFVAGPGDVTLTLTLEGTGWARNRVNFMGVGFELFNEEDQRIRSGGVRAYTPNARAVERIKFSRRQRVLLHVKISERSDSAKYWLRLSGPVDIGQDVPIGSGGITGIGDTNGVQDSINLGLSLPGGGSLPLSGRAAEAKESCLPKQGTLIVKMKDGSKKIIDLSEAETITIVP